MNSRRRKSTRVDSDQQPCRSFRTLIPNTRAQCSLTSWLRPTNEPEQQVSSKRWRTMATTLGSTRPRLLSARQARSLIALIFVMTVLWCFLAHAIVNHPKWGLPICSYGHRLAPIVRIGIGVLILYQASSFELLLRLKPCNFGSEHACVPSSGATRLIRYYSCVRPIVPSLKSGHIQLCFLGWLSVTILAVIRFALHQVDDQVSNKWFLVPNLTPACVIYRTTRSTPRSCRPQLTEGIALNCGDPSSCVTLFHSSCAIFASASVAITEAS